MAAPGKMTGFDGYPIRSGGGGCLPFFIDEFDENVRGLNNENYMEQKRIAILVAEDDKVCQFFICKIKSEDYSIEIAENGKEAVEKANEKMYDLIFMDYQMPVCDGVDAVRQIRSFNPTVPIIVQSSCSDDTIYEAFSGLSIQGSLGGKLRALEQIEKVVSNLRTKKMI